MTEIKKSRVGQIAIEALLGIPVLISGSLLIALSCFGMLNQHFTWIDAVTLHRSRVYDIHSSCNPHSLWPEFARPRITTFCGAAATQIQSKQPGFKEINVTISSSVSAKKAHP